MTPLPPVSWASFGTSWSGMKLQIWRNKVNLLAVGLFRVFIHAYLVAGLNRQASLFLSLNPQSYESAMNQILSILGKIVRAFFKMPVVLKFISVAVFLLFFCIPLALLPTKMLFVEGDIKAFDQFRMNGGSVLLFSVGCVSIVVIYGLMVPKKWVRHVVIILGIVLFLTPLKYSDWNIGEIIFNLIVFVFIPYWVFYVNPSVKRYLSG